LQTLQHLTIVGGGSWATALVKIFSESNIVVTWYLRSQSHVDYLLSNGRNPHYLSFLQLNLQFIRPTSSLEEAVAASDDVLFAVPSAYLEPELAALETDILYNKRLYVSIKGLVSERNLLPSVFIARHFDRNADEITVLAGPCHAEEIAMDRRTFLTIAGTNDTVVNRMREAVHVPYLHVITNDDPLGVEYAAILKNVIGIACGMVRGLNYGDNFLAVVVSNSMREVQRFLRAVDDRPRDLYDSVYFGDLLVTAYSAFSRNASFGQMIGRGYSVPMAESKMHMIAEGYPAVKGVLQMARALEIEMPVLSAAYRMLYKHASPFTEFKLLETQLR